MKTVSRERLATVYPSKARYTIEFLNDSTPSEENGEASPLMPDDSLCRIAIETAFAR